MDDDEGEMDVDVLFMVMASVTTLSGRHVEMLPVSPRVLAWATLTGTSERQALYTKVAFVRFDVSDPLRIQTCAVRVKYANLQLGAELSDPQGVSSEPGASLFGVQRVSERFDCRGRSLEC